MSARNIHYLTGFVLITAISVGFYLWTTDPEVQIPPREHLEITRVYSSGVLDWKELLSERRGLARPEDWTRIDFSPPGSPTFGDNPEYEFFNPAGKFKARPLSVEGRALKPIFNVRRFITSPDTNGAGVVLIQHTSLYAIIPINANCNITEDSFKPAKDNTVIIVDKNVAPDCYRANDGTSYYLVRIAGKSITLTE